MSFLLLGAAGLAISGVYVAAVYGVQKFVAQSEGLKVVYKDEGPEIDIVLVHGLEGHPIHTWTSRKQGQDVNWTTDFLPERIMGHDGCPKAIRVLSYGYSSRLFSGSQNGTPARPTDGRFLKYLPQALFLHSTRLIEQLAKLRVDGAEQRRVIFIAHSLGGLIVKSALVHASAAIGKREARLKAIELLTIGVLFFGTPQREMLWKKWSDLLRKMFQVAMLTPLDGIVQPVADQIEQLNLQIERYKSIETNFPNFSFFEAGKDQKRDSRRRTVKITPREPLNTSADDVQVVDAEMAIPTKVKKSTWEKIPFQRSHKDLVKFDSDIDPDYLEVVARLNKCLQLTNYEGALDRYRRFFARVGSSNLSEEDLINVKQVISTHWPKSELSLVRVNSSDSKDDIDNKQKSNMDLLKKCERENGLSDQTTLSAVKFIANNSVEAHDYEVADALYKRLFVAKQETFSPSSAEAAAALKDVAEVAIRQGRLVEATRILYHVREIQTTLGLKEDRETLKVTEQIAGLCESRGLHDDALEEYGKVIKHSRDTLGEFDDETLRVMKIEAKIWRRKGRRDKHAQVIAQEKLEEIARIGDRLARANHSTDPARDFVTPETSSSEKGDGFQEIRAPRAVKRKNRESIARKSSAGD